MARPGSARDRIRETAADGYGHSPPVAAFARGLRAGIRLPRRREKRECRSSDAFVDAGQHRPTSPRRLLVLSRSGSSGPGSRPRGKNSGTRPPSERLREPPRAHVAPGRSLPRPGSAAPGPWGRRVLPPARLARGRSCWRLQLAGPRRGPAEPEIDERQERRRPRCGRSPPRRAPSTPRRRRAPARPASSGEKTGCGFLRRQRPARNSCCASRWRPVARSRSARRRPSISASPPTSTMRFNILRARPRRPSPR